MSTKEEISEQLSAYLDGELSDEESRRVDEMLTGDPALSDELESLREVRQLLRGLPSEQAPDGLIDAALTQAQHKHTEWWAGYLARAAVIVLAVGIGVIVTARLNRPARENGTRTPAYSNTPHLARSGLAGLDIVAPAGVTNVLINTDNLVLTQREVEGVFGRNSVEPMVATEDIRIARGASDTHRSMANYYSQTQVATNQIRYELAITENQMRQIVSGLNEIRARQNVAQCAAGDSPRDRSDTLALAGAYSRDQGAAKDKRSGHDAAERNKGESVAKKPPAFARKRKETDSKPASAGAHATPKMEQQRGTGEIRRQTTTASAVANVQQLVVILNVVGKK